MITQQLLTTCARHSSQRWFALQVRPRQEKTIAAILNHKGYDQFLPLRKVRRRFGNDAVEIGLPLFPGYVFCRFDPKYRLPILVTPGVQFVVGIGKTPLPVDDDEIAALQEIVRSGYVVEPWEYLKIGQTVRINAGPLCGLEGILAEHKNGDRIVVSVSLLQRSVAVEVDAHWLQPIGGTNACPYAA